MTVIDVHAHVLAPGWLPEEWWRGYRDYARRAAGPLALADTSDDREARLMDPTAETLLASMDSAGISRCVLLPLDFGLALGEPEVPIEEQNRLIWALHKAHPDRLLAFVGVDPRRKGAVDLVAEGVTEHGARGIKLYPACGFFPDDERTLEFLERTARYRVPVLVHSGHAAPPLRSRFCDPLRLDEALLRFPDTDFIAAHLGGGWHDQLFWMGRTRANLFVDISGWQPLLLRNPQAFAARLREAIDSLGPYRVLFGTDAPFYESQCPALGFLQSMRRLPDSAPGGIAFRRGEIQALLGGNASRLLGNC